MKEVNKELSKIVPRYPEKKPEGGRRPMSSIPQPTQPKKAPAKDSSLNARKDSDQVTKPAKREQSAKREPAKTTDKKPTIAKMEASKPKRPESSKPKKKPADEKPEVLVESKKVSGEDITNIQIIK